MGNENNEKALKSGVWYIVSNFIMKGLVFFTTPIFTRLLNQEEFGLYNNFISWLTTMHVFVALNLEASFISARYEFENDFNGYVSSMIGLSTLSSIIWLIVINIFSPFFEKFTNLNTMHLNILVVYLMFTAIINQFQTKERYYFRYKVSVFTSMIISIGSTVLSVILVSFMNDKLTGRILGYTLISILIGGILFIYLMKNGKKIDLKYWKYALPICLPYIPHLLSLSILNSVDKIMITQICGSMDTALYSLAYTCGAIVSVLVVSINTAFAPWLGDRLKEEKIREINKFSTIYVLIFCFLACGVMLIAPEILYIMGGKEYTGSIYVMPPVAFGFVCQFIYTMYVNIEQFKKKTIGMAFASVIAAAINYFLNLWLIPKYGYIAAAYTTLFSFLCLMMIHMFLVYNLGYIKTYNTKNIIILIIVVAIFTAVVNILYSLPIIRYFLILIYAVVFVTLLYRNRKYLYIIIRQD